MTKARATQAAALPPFDKYWHYSRSVQSPDEDMKFMLRVYQDARGAKAQPKVLREDFCGTFANCCSWVKLGPGRSAHGVDLDPEPIEYGRQNYLSKLPSALQKKITIHLENVLGKNLPKADVICGMNFSYFIFKERETLKAYFKNCLKTLNEKGVLVLDCFGGSHCQEANEEETEFDDEGFSYFWDQLGFDPLTNHAKYAIHFRRKGEKKRKDVFTYDWRMWTPPELRDLLLEVGFKDVRFYWEGTTAEGDGDGEFSIATQGEECFSWVTYIAALK